MLVRIKVRNPMNLRLVGASRCLLCVLNVLLVLCRHVMTSLMVPTAFLGTEVRLLTLRVKTRVRLPLSVATLRWLLPLIGVGSLLVVTVSL